MSILLLFQHLQIYFSFQFYKNCALGVKSINKNLYCENNRIKNNYYFLYIFLHKFIEIKDLY